MDRNYKFNKLFGGIIFVFLSIFTFITATSVYAATPLTLSGASTVPVTRNVTGVSNPVVNTFTYTITPDASNPATVSNAPTSLTIAFDGSETISSNTVTKSGNIDFNGATFTEPGNYTFRVVESASTNSTTYPVSTDQYDVFVQVRYDTTANDGTMVATVLNQGKLTTENTKSNIVYPANSRFTNISISKTVTGDMGDISRYFAINVTVPGNTGDSYVVSGGSYQSNPNSITANTETTIYLKSGETIQIGYDSTNSLNQIPIGDSYTVSEDAVEHYTTTIDNTEVSTINKTTVVDPNSNITNIVNDYSTANLTGIILNITPFVILIIISAIGFVFFKKKKIKKNN